MLKNTFTVLSGTVVAQVIGFLALPLLTRLYTPEAFGLFLFYQSLMAPLLVVAALRFEVALLSADDDAELASMLQLCFLVNALLTVVVLLFCCIFWMIFDLAPETTAKIIWLIPCGFLIGGVLQTIGYLALRRKAFGAGANAKIVQVGCYVGTGIGIGAISAIPNG